MLFCRRGSDWCGDSRLARKAIERLSRSLERHEGQGLAQGELNRCVAFAVADGANVVPSRWALAASRLLAWPVDRPNAQ